MLSLCHRLYYQVPHHFCQLHDMFICKVLFDGLVAFLGRPYVSNGRSYVLLLMLSFLFIFFTVWSSSVSRSPQNFVTWLEVSSVL